MTTASRARWAEQNYPSPNELPGPGGGGSVAYNVVLRPGDTSKAENVFTTSAALFAAATEGNWQGQVLVTVDDSIVSPVHLTAETVDMGPALNWTFTGVASFNDVRSEAAMVIDDGFHIDATGPVQLTFDNLDITSPATTDVCTVGANIEFNLVLDGSRLAMQGTGASLNSSSGLGFAEVFIHDFSELGDGVHPAIKGAAGASIIDAETGSHIRAASMSGGGVVSFDASTEQDIAPAAGFTFIMQDQAARVGYPPGAPANWPGVVKPSEVQQALDDVAADLAGHLELQVRARDLERGAQLIDKGGSTSDHRAVLGQLEEDAVASKARPSVHLHARGDVHDSRAARVEHRVFLDRDGGSDAGAHVFEMSGVVGAHSYGIRATNQSGRTITVFNQAAYARVEDLFP